MGVRDHKGALKSQALITPPPCLEKVTHFIYDSDQIITQQDHMYIYPEPLLNAMMAGLESQTDL